MRRAIVTLDDEHSNRSADVEQDLSRHGFVLAQSLSTLGVLLGTCPGEAFDALPNVSGVLNVVEDRQGFRPLNQDASAETRKLRIG